MSVSVQEIRTHGVLQAFAPEWWDLWYRCPRATPFQSPAWLIAWWQAFAPGELLTLAFREGHRLLGVAPFYIESGTRRVLPLGISLSDYFDLLIEPSASEIVVTAFDDYLCRTAAEWEWWEFCELPPQAFAQSLPSPAHCEELQEACSVCPVLNLPDGGQLREAVPAHRLQSLRTAWHRIQRAGKSHVIEAGAESVRDLLGLLAQFINRRIRERTPNEIAVDERVRCFHRLCVIELLDRRLLRLYALQLEGQVIAAQYVLQHRDRSYSYLTGFDMGHETFSPGTILLGYAIEQCLHTRQREFHFLRGTEHYKYLWGARDRINVRRVFLRARAYDARLQHPLQRVMHSTPRELQSA